MKGKVNKGFFSYLFMFVGIALGVILICCAIMMMSDVTIFGWKYEKHKTVYTVKTLDGEDGTKVLSGGQEIVPNATPTSIDFKKLETVEIVSNDTKFELIHGDLDKIEVVNSVKGFSKESKIVDFEVLKNYDQENKKLTITIIDRNPDLALSNKKEAAIYVSDNAYKNLNIVVRTQSGNANFATKAFRSSDIRDIVYGSVSVETKSGDVNFSKNVSFPAGYNIQTQSGKITFDSNIQTSNLSLVTNSGYIKGQNLKAENISISAESSFVEFGNIDGSVICGVKNGDFRTGNISGSLIDESDVVDNTNFVVGNVGGDVTIPSATKSNLTFGEISGAVSLKTESGSISIKKLKKLSEIVSKSGKVSVLVDANNNEKVFIQTKSGKVSAVFENVLGEKIIDTEKGDVNVVYKEGIVFKLSATTSKEISFPNENYSVSNQTIVGYPAVSDTEIETSNTLTITSKSGDINISRKGQVSFDLVS